MQGKGYLALVLHAHLPFVRHPEQERFMEEDWFFEAVLECYLPLWERFDRLIQEQVPFHLTLVMTPTLLAMLKDDNPSTTIAFGLKKSGYVSLRIYDASGRLVKELVDETRPVGSYTVEWNGRENKGSDTASGVYFYRLIAGEFKETKKMILLR